MSTNATFGGFPAAGIRFLRELERNNERDWFEAHKAQYLEAVLEPTKAFVVALGQRLQTISPHIQYGTSANGSESIMRIYRDLRFSQDKRPYEPNIRVFFWEGQGKRMENPGFLVRIDPDGVELYGGVHVFAKPLLTAYRQAVDDDALASELETAIAAVRDTGDYEVGGAHYKRVPRGYDADHPRADLLRYNGLWVHAPNAVDPALITTPDLLDACVAHCRKMAPIHQWLVQVTPSAG